MTAKKVVKRKKSALRSTRPKGRPKAPKKSTKARGRSKKQRTKPLRKTSKKSRSKKPSRSKSTKSQKIQRKSKTKKSARKSKPKHKKTVREKRRSKKRQRSKKDKSGSKGAKQKSKGKRSVKIVSKTFTATQRPVFVVDKTNPRRGTEGPDRFKIRDVKNDGNCFFHTLAIVLGLKDPDAYKQLRYSLVKQMKRKLETDPRQEELFKIQNGRAPDFDKLLKDGAWAHAEMDFLINNAHEFVKRTIVLHQRGSTSQVLEVPGTDPVHILYVGGSHYMALKKKHQK